MIEDDSLLSELLAQALRERLKISEQHVFETGRAGVDYCLKEEPDLLIVDLGLPDMNGREIIRRLRQRWPNLRVIVLTGEVNPTLPAELLAIGVSGFVHKTSSFAEMESAIRRVLADGMYFSAALKPSHANGRLGSARALGPPPSVLVEREREIVRLVTSGLISKEIADRLDLSPRTIEKARARILTKLGVRDLPALVRWALQHGLI